MSIGYFLVLGDSTSCGGHVLEGSPSVIFHGLPVAFAGAKVSCGKNLGKIYSILGGIPNIIDMGVPRAGTLDSRSSCPCHAFLIPSILNATYYPMEQRAQAVRASAVEPEQHAQAAKRSLVQEPAPAPVAPAQEPEPQREPIEPGFCIVDLPATVEDFGNYLFYNPVAGARELYDSLNGSGYIKPASILLLVDPLKQTPEQVETLKKAKARIDKALAPLTNEEANFFHKHKDAIEAFTGYGSNIIGTVSEVGGKYFEEIEKVLKDIHKTYENAFITRGALIGEQFYVARTMQFKKLNLLLNNFMKYKLGMRQYDDIRKALGLSSRSIMHHWSQTGVSGIEGYATYIEKSAKLVKAMKKLGYIGIGFDFAGTTNSIYEACSVGRESECKRTSFTEIGKLTGNEVGSFAGGVMAAELSGSFCMLGLGMLTSEIGGVGALLCTAVGVTGGIVGGDYIGSMTEDLGGVAGKEIYEAFYNE
ncbi:PAAR domain-containing protein [Rahnella laticis]|uniref:PAAR domain-containing protein n=1 Tax=Rahnella laticis TaxID=2787622 RepID=UPI0018A32BAC|nr:PAAR domain-containing protein [Rahnella laticis]MBF7995444.1 PAAR domain-containing protein [Rahnella laticis]